MGSFLPPVCVIRNTDPADGFMGTDRTCRLRKAGRVRGLSQIGELRNCRHHIGALQNVARHHSLLRSAGDCAIKRDGSISFLVTLRASSCTVEYPVKACPCGIPAILLRKQSFPRHLERARSAILSSQG
ncbi:hypothetical protein CDV49_04980 [Haematobacter genomosp. 1]|uniref:Uncharacterized protein n=1 Tax=Haematobacter genomosp. 1 TaxID=366618 RepID=A0A212AE99_9RHOB|nr:hypothetical protein CDV49_04980 [Haematobacter genomosp. 1]